MVQDYSGKKTRLLLIKSSRQNYMSIARAHRIDKNNFVSFGRHASNIVDSTVYVDAVCVCVGECLLFTRASEIVCVCLAVKTVASPFKMSTHTHFYE